MSLTNRNSEYYIALECKDLQANAMAVDSTGTYVLLAGYVNARGLNLISFLGTVPVFLFSLQNMITYSHVILYEIDVFS